MTTTPLLAIMATWSPEQKLAAYDLCRSISESLWYHDQDALLEAMMRDDHKRGFDHHLDADDRNLELPFEDTPPF